MSNFIAFSLIALARRKKYHKHTKRVIQTIHVFSSQTKKGRFVEAACYTLFERR